MKKLKMFALSILAMLFMVNFVNAETNESISVEDYDSLKTAIADTEVTIITLTKDIVATEEPGFTIPSGRTITIDLNGKTLSMVSSATTTSYLIKNQGSLTIKDSSDTNKDGSGTGKITYSSTTPDTAASPGYASNAIANSGTIVLESGVLENSTIKAPAAHVIDNYSGGKITINGGKVNSVNNWAIRMFVTSETASNDFLMNNGYVNGGVKLQVATSNIKPKASFTVNNGTITGKTYGFYLYDFSTKGSDVNVEINGGNFNTTGENSYAAYIYSTNANVEINDGTFTGTYALIYFTYYPYDEITHVINNGTFNGIVELDQKFTTNPEENYKSNFLIKNGKFSDDVLVWGYDGTDWYISTNTQFITGGIFNVDATKHVATGLVSKKIGDVYVVAVEKAINVTEVTNGTVTVDKTKAIVGEEVTITVTPNEGYEITTLKVVDADNKEITIENNKFVMPNGEVTVTATLTKVETTVSLPTVDEDEEVEEVTVGVTNAEKTEEVLLESLTEALKNEDQKELADALTNSSAIVEVEIANVEEDVIDEEIVSAIVKEAGKATIATYFDISVAVKNASDGNKLGNLSELTKEIELVVLLPETLKNTDEEVTRKYYVIRRHVNEDGKVEIEKLDTTLSNDGKSLSFKTDKFSTYAIAYEDEEIVDENQKVEIEEDKKPNENPKTLDNISLYLVLGTLSLVAFASVVIYRKKRYN